MTKQNDDLSFGELMCILTVVFAFGITIGWFLWGINKPQYDTDCLDELANKICIEEGYESGTDGNHNDIGDTFLCYQSKRSHTHENLKWIEGEKEQCIK